jgi:hypothetical protein
MSKHIHVVVLVLKIVGVIARRALGIAVPQIVPKRLFAGGNPVANRQPLGRPTRHTASVPLLDVIGGELPQLCFQQSPLGFREALVRLLLLGGFGVGLQGFNIQYSTINSVMAHTPKVTANAKRDKTITINPVLNIFPSFKAPCPPLGLLRLITDSRAYWSLDTAGQGVVNGLAVANP